VRAARYWHLCLFTIELWIFYKTKIVAEIQGQNLGKGFNIVLIVFSVNREIARSFILKVRLKNNFDRAALVCLLSQLCNLFYNDICRLHVISDV
jgi:hypothetical protein